MINVSEKSISRGFVFKDGSSEFSVVGESLESVMSEFKGKKLHCNSLYFYDSSLTEHPGTFFNLSVTQIKERIKNLDLRNDDFVKIYEVKKAEDMLLHEGGFFVAKGSEKHDIENFLFFIDLASFGYNLEFMAYPSSAKYDETYTVKESLNRTSSELKLKVANKLSIIKDETEILSFYTPVRQRSYELFLKGTELNFLGCFEYTYYIHKFMESIAETEFAKSKSFVNLVEESLRLWESTEDDFDYSDKLSKYFVKNMYEKPDKEGLSLKNIYNIIGYSEGIKTFIDHIPYASSKEVREVNNLLTDADLKAIDNNLKPSIEFLSSSFFGELELPVSKAFLDIITSTDPFYIIDESVDHEMSFLSSGDGYKLLNDSVSTISNNPNCYKILTYSDNGTLGGYILLSIDSNKSAFIECLEVSKERRRTGIGKKLLKEAIDVFELTAIEGAIAESEESYNFWKEMLKDSDNKLKKEYSEVKDTDFFFVEHIFYTKIS